MRESDLREDYREFVDAGEECPPFGVSRLVLNSIRRELHPRHVVVFGKVLLVQGVMGLLTLLFCPQFGVGLNDGFLVLHHLHHSYSEEACMLLCGAIFAAPGAMLASYLLRVGEVKRVKGAGVWYHLMIAVLAVFILGADTSWQAVLFWVIGASMTAMIVFDVNLVLRPHLRIFGRRVVSFYGMR